MLRGWPDPPARLQSAAMAQVLLVADEPWVRNQVRAALSRPDDELREVSDPRAVVAAIQEFEPEVVLVDLQVGTMGAMAITREIREAFLAGRITRVGVVVVVDRSCDAFLAWRGGAQAWLAKPFTPFELRRAISRAQEALEAATR